MDSGEARARRVWVACGAERAPDLAFSIHQLVAGSSMDEGVAAVAMFLGMIEADMPDPDINSLMAAVAMVANKALQSRQDMPDKRSMLQ